jgi:hypothetical protein
VALAISPAWATEPTNARHAAVRLVYVRGPGADQCPEPEALRAAVAARLGYEPFRDDAMVTVSATLSRRDSVTRAVIELRDGTGEVTGRREISSKESDCSELAAAAALAISIAVDPKSASRPTSPPVAGTPPSVSDPLPSLPANGAKALPPPDTPPRRPAPDAVRSVRILGRAGLGVLGAFGAAPAPALGFSFFGGARRGALSVDLEGRGDLPAGEAIAASTTLTAKLFLGTLAPCFHLRALLGCGLVAGGALIGSSDRATAPTRMGATPFVALGGRAGVEKGLVAGLAGRLTVDLLGTVTRITLDVRGSGSWRTPPVTAALGAGVLWSFP